MRLFVLRSQPGYLHYYDPSKVCTWLLQHTKHLWNLSLVQFSPGDLKSITRLDSILLSLILTQFLWPDVLFVLCLIHFLSGITCQDDINPAGGFSLRGCLVSALDDNGVPSGESPAGVGADNNY